MGHLTADERRRLETLLNRGESFRSIAEVLGKSHSTYRNGWEIKL